LGDSGIEQNPKVYNEFSCKRIFLKTAWKMALLEMYHPQIKNEESQNIAFEKVIWLELIYAQDGKKSKQLH
jgi:hypothetical protein